MKKLLCAVVGLLMTVCLIIGMTPAIVIADDDASVNAAPTAYVKQGLVAWYDGVNNTRNGHDNHATVWEDLISGYDLPMEESDKGCFTEEGFHISAAAVYNFPQQIVDLVNGQAFTVEIRLGEEFKSIGSNFNTFMNSRNDNFALFRRNENDVIEFKYAANSRGERPTVDDGLSKLQGALISITYEVGGKTYIYLNGQKVASADSPKEMGADSLFIGNGEQIKSFDTVYRSIRFYDRALEENEITYNAVVDGYGSVKDLYVQDGLVALYSGIQNTADGYNAAADTWVDLASGYHVTLSLNDNNHFTREGMHINTSRQYFPQEIVNLINADEFTVEMYLGDLVSVGTAYNTFINSANDAFSLFRRNADDILEFKFGSNSRGERPAVADGLNIFANSLVTITYKVGQDVTVYVNGLQVAQVGCPRTMGADNLFFGHDLVTHNFDTTYKSIRFYNRALTEKEVLANAKADAVCPASFSLEPTSYTVTFVAGNQVVAVVEFPAGATSVTEPAVPSKEGYIGAWAPYTMSDKNFTVKAVYTMIPSEETTVAEQPTEPVTDPVTEAPTTPETQPVTDMITEKVTEKITEPTSEQGSATAVESATETEAASSGCQSTIALGGLIALLAMVLGVIRFKKKQ